MKILASNFEPLKTSHPSYVETWSRFFHESDAINIAVGYASNDSVLYLKSLIEWHQPKKLNICVGMANFDGMFRSQFHALQNLDSVLKNKEIGGVFIANQFPFHGKVQTFRKSAKLLGGLIGSSNLSNIIPPKGIHRGTYELDLQLSDAKVVQEVDSFIRDLILSASVSLEFATPLLKVKPDINPMMDGRFEVALVSPLDLESVKAQRTNDSFVIPLKGTPKSNMNVYFGKGRDNKRGFVAPRSWYEVEIMPGQAVMNSSSNYPDQEKFIVYTDDQYKFVLYTGGDKNKNLRSRDDLTTLGRWLKGRLEIAGALESGKVVDDQVFQSYGRNNMTLTRTERTELDKVSGVMLQVWYADFGLEK